MASRATPAGPRVPACSRMDPEAAEVKASGGVVWRAGPGGEPEIVVVHRPRYDDWSLPKGKLDPGERWDEAALREVWEEVGLRCRLGEELPPIAYRDNKGRAKVVRYWLMEAEDGAGTFEPNDEVDEMRWVDPGTAGRLLSYPHDAALVREAAGRL
jgi:8-oxo-dGTP pyrophosphatase MutT (NUDIX family)